MNILIDLILPPIIVAFLIGMIFNVNSLILTSSIENRLMYDLQGSANRSMMIIQEELRELRSLDELDSNHIRYVTIEYDTTTIYRDGRDLVIARRFADGSTVQTRRLPARLADLSFSPAPVELALNPLLTVSIRTESLPEQEVGEREFHYTGVAKRDIYLRTLHLSNL